MPSNKDTTNKININTIACLNNISAKRNYASGVILTRGPYDVSFDSLLGICDKTHDVNFNTPVQCKCNRVLKKNQTLFNRKVYLWFLEPFVGIKRDILFHNRSTRSEHVFQYYLYCVKLMYYSPRTFLLSFTFSIITKRITVPKITQHNSHTNLAIICRKIEQTNLCHSPLIEKIYDK